MEDSIHKKELERQSRLEQAIFDQLGTIKNRIKLLEERVNPLENSNQISSSNNLGNIRIKESKKARLQKLNKKFASSTTVYGISRVSNAQNTFMKLAWTLMSLLSLAAGLYCICNTLEDYLSYHVFTQTKRIEPSSSLLPAIFFCAQSPNVSHAFHNTWFANKTDTTNLTGLVFPSNLVYGEFSGYVCIKFGGPEQMFSVMDKNYDFYQFELSFETVDFTYVDVFVADNFVNVLDWSLFVTSFDGNKKVSFIDLTKRVEIELEEPFNECHATLDHDYRQANCVFKCKAEQFVRRLNCTLTGYYWSVDYEFCEGEISSSVEFDADCVAKCPKECVSAKFDVLISGYEADLLTIYITYQDTSYMELSETPKMDGFSVIAEIGGHLGLFIGITFMSLLEFLEYVSDIFLMFYKR